MKILVTGASGLVGSALVPFLIQQGYTVLRLVRHSPQHADERFWDPETRQLDNRLSDEAVEAVIHLAGENIAGKRWTPQIKAAIKNSRLTGTQFLCETMTKWNFLPKMLISASAIGYYGNRGEEILTEASVSGQGFLPEVCQGWEAATQQASASGIRVVNMRFGIILSPHGGALAKMLPVFKLGLGGPLGNGRQFMSWIAMADVVEAISHVIKAENLFGPVNMVSPNSVRNSEFTKAVGDILRRPAIAPVPGLGLRLLMGEMADALLLSSTRAVPVRLTESGYSFVYPQLEGALQHLLAS